MLGFERADLMQKDITSAARVTIVTVSYNSLAVLPAMLASVPQGAAVVVVDNASTDQAELRALCDRHGARLVCNPRNLGFGYACNLGAAGAKTEFLLFLNPDATLMPDTLDQLVSAAARHPHASALNPRIAEPDGSPAFHRSTPLLPRGQWMARGWPAADTEVAVLTGAAMFVRRAAFEAVDGFDPNIFLYHEDDDLSLRLRASAGPLVFVRDAMVRHAGGGSSPRSPASAAFKAWHNARSRVYACRKHGRPLPFATTLLRAIAGLLAPDMIFSARRRAKNWAYLKGTLSAISDGGATRKANDAYSAA